MKTVIEKVKLIGIPIAKVLAIEGIEIVLNIIIQILFLFLIKVGAYQSREGLEPSDYISAYNTYIYVIVFTIAILIFVFAIKKEQISWKIGKNLKKWCFVSCVIGIIAAIIVNSISFKPETIVMTYSEAAVYVLYSVIIAPIAEEIVYRDYLFNHLYKVMNIYWAVILSSFVFALMHLDFSQFLYTFPMGCIFAIIYLKQGCLFSIIAHIMFNLTAMLMPYIVR